eukprot:jgi/Mesvir1/14663/Mv26252-RA.1
MYYIRAKISRGLLRDALDRRTAALEHDLGRDGALLHGPGLALGAGLLAGPDAVLVELLRLDAIFVVLPHDPVQPLVGVPVLDPGADVVRKGEDDPIVHRHDEDVEVRVHLHDLLGVFLGLRHIVERPAEFERQVVGPGRHDQADDRELLSLDVDGLGILLGLHGPLGRGGGGRDLALLELLLRGRAGRRGQGHVRWDDDALGRRRIGDGGDGRRLRGFLVRHHARRLETRVLLLGEEHRSADRHVHELAVGRHFIKATDFFRVAESAPRARGCCR